MEIAFGDFIEIMANITLILVAIFGVLSVVMSNVLRFFRAKDFGIDFKLTYINPSDYFASFFTVIVLLGMGVVFPHIFVWIFNSFFEAEHGTVWIGLVISSILTSMTVFLFMFITRYGFKKTYFFVLPLCLSHIMKMFYHLFLIGGTNTCQTLMQALNIASYIWTAFIFLYCAAEIIFSQGIESHVFKMKRTMKICSNKSISAPNFSSA